MANPNAPRRDQLEKLLPSIDLIRQFERLFEQAGELSPSAIADLNELVNGNTQEINDNIQKIVNVTADYTAPLGNYSIIADATSGVMTVTLPPADEAYGFSYGVTKKDTSANDVIIQGNGADTIVGEVSQTLEVDGEVINVISDGNNWEILN